MVRTSPAPVVDDLSQRDERARVEDNQYVTSLLLLMTYPHPYLSSVAPVVFVRYSDETGKTLSFLLNKAPPKAALQDPISHPAEVLTLAKELEAVDKLLVRLVPRNL